MDLRIINGVAFFSCLLGIGVGWWLFRWAQRQLALMAGERQVVMNKRLGLLGRRAHARALLVGGVVIFAVSIDALVTLFIRAR